MLYELIRRDPVWKDGRWGLGLCAFLSLIPKMGGLDLGAIYGPLYVVGALFVAMPQRRATTYEATLPIPARTLFLARAISVLGSIWITSAVAVLAYLVSRGGGDPAFKSLTAAAVCTLGAALLLCFRLAYLNGPAWSLLLVYLCAMFSFLPIHLHALVPAACLAAGLILLLWGWRAAPNAFQLPARSVERRHGRQLAAGPATRWMPAIRSVFSWPYVFACVMTTMVAFTGAWLAAGFTVCVAWMSVRVHMRWMRTLPVRPRGLLALFVAPLFALPVIAYFLTYRIGRHPRPAPTVRFQILELGGAFAWVLLILLMCALVDWRPLVRQKRVVFIAVSTLVSIAPLVGFVFFIGRHTMDPLHEAILRMAADYPGHWAGAMALVAAVLAVLWRLLEKLYSESEYTDKVRPNLAWE